MRRLFVHCGLGKTGTSAIQAHLRDTPPPGLIYPETGQWPDGAHHKLAFALRGQRRRGNIEIPSWDELGPALIAELDAAEGTVVISSEILDPKSADMLLANVLQRLARPFDEINVIVVLRHPLELAASTYNQSVKDPVVSEARLPDVYLSKSGPSFSLKPILHTWNKCRFDVRFVNYHPADTIVTRFLDALGFGGLDLHPNNQLRNVSMNGYALIALLAANQLKFSDVDRAALFDLLRSDKSNKIWSGPSFPFSEKASRRFMNDVAREDLLALRSKTGMDLTSFHAISPERFRLDVPQQRALKNAFDQFDLSENHERQLHDILREFETEPTDV